jgi:hypothetical protein
LFIVIACAAAIRPFVFARASRRRPASLLIVIACAAAIRIFVFTSARGLRPGRLLSVIPWGDGATTHTIVLRRTFFRARAWDKRGFASGTTDLFAEYLFGNVQLPVALGAVNRNGHCSFSLVADCRRRTKEQKSNAANNQVDRFYGSVNLYARNKNRKAKPSCFVVDTMISRSAA